MDDIDIDIIEITLIVDLVVPVWIAFIFVLFAQPPDDSMMPIYIIVITFVVLVVAELLCWLFHISAWIYKGLTWIHDKTEPKGVNHES